MDNYAETIYMDADQLTGVDIVNEQAVENEFHDLMENFDRKLGYDIDCVEFIGINDEGQSEYIVYYEAEREAELWDH